MATHTFRDKQMEALHRELISIRTSAPEPLGAWAVAPQVSGWVGRARVYIAAEFPEHLAAFDRASSVPNWRDIPRLSSAERVFAGITRLSQEERDQRLTVERNSGLTADWIRGLLGTLEGIDTHAEVGRRPRELVSSLQEPMAAPQTCDVVLLTALRVEYAAVRALITDPREAVHPKGTIYEVGQLGPLRVAIAEIGAGNQTAAMEAERAIAFFVPSALAFVGVAGGIKDVRLGDVVVANKIYGYESAKDAESESVRPSIGEPAYKFVQRARASGRNDKWKEGQNIPAQIQVHVGAIAAGEKVVASTKSATYQLIKRHYGDTLAVEMEGRGTLIAAHSNADIATLLVRGISDCIDDKADADAAGSQAAASHHAAVFAAHVLVSTLTPRDPNAAPRPPEQRSAPPRQDVRVRADYGSIILPGAGREPIDVVIIIVENHGVTKVFLDGGVYFTERGVTTKGWIGTTALGMPLLPRELEVGDAASFPVRASDLLEYRSRIDKFFVSDRLGTEFYVSSEETRKAIDLALDD
ncbi:5'-methylthioadenosine/S-adenosylhomocysteine nucleosidase [Sorangium sp. So ce590]|uniref:5'-methylthioadenosine/S-adenosylhomocysteine nucleosidase family protein n=1 Tax=Sorangium sp. So ce590 TaxID=3133317 RepID=UPI003F63BD8A